MAWITLPFPAFHLESGRQPAQQLDDDFAAIVNALNAFNPSGSPSGPGGSYAVRRLVGFNNAGTPTTKYDLAADLVVMRDLIAGSLMVRDTIGPLTNDIGLTGPAPNGRDQVAAFSNNSWIHLYFIGNPTTGTVATISSAVFPPGGPALPSGFSLWAYAGALRLDAGTTIIPTYMRGAQMSYRNQQNVVLGANPTINTEQPVNLSDVVPPNGVTFVLNISNLIVTNTGSTGTNLMVRVVTGQDLANIRSAAEAVATGCTAAQLLVPNVGAQVIYLYNMDTPGTHTASINIDISGYRVPNGGE